MNALPTFLIIGAQRAGTSFLHDLCSSHPDVYLPGPGTFEPKFFSTNEEYAKGFSYYIERYFNNVEGFIARGEKSVHYFDFAEIVAHRIWQYIPDVKLLIMLRNPIERAFSNYLYSCKEGLEALSFADAVELESSRKVPLRWKYTRPFAYMARGFYAQKLRFYLEVFPREQIKILLLDDIILAPEDAEREVFRFIGVSETAASFNLRQKVNSARVNGTDIDEGLYEFLRGVYYHPNLELSKLIGRNLDDWNRKRK